MSNQQPPSQPEISEAAIRSLAVAIGTYCWRHDFAHFCETTGFTGGYAEEKWRDLKALDKAIRAFDAQTLAKILEAR